VSAEAFGLPDAADLLIAIGDVYFAHGALPEGVRLFVSGIPRDVASATLKAVAIELDSVPDE
jgi:NAD(P)H-nitrite reductase large subunit